MIRFTCPKCETGLKSSDDKAGTKTTCPRCGERLRVPSPDEEPAEDQLEEEPEEGEEEQEESTPKKKSKGKKASAPAKGGKKPPVALFIGLGAVLLVLGGGSAFYFMSGGGNEAPKSEEPMSAPGRNIIGRGGGPRAPGIVAAPKPGGRPAPKDAGKSPDAGQAADAGKHGEDGAGKAPGKPADSGATQVAAKPDAKLEPRPAVSPPGKSPISEAPPAAPGAAPSPMSTEASSLQATQVYKRALKSVCWIVSVGNDKASSGSGSLIDQPNRLVLTNYHVVRHVIKDRSGMKLLVFFPMYERGQPVADREAYASLIKRGEGTPGWVEYFDKRRDLALVKIPGAPDTTQPIQLSTVPVITGQAVYSVGNPGAAGALWVLSGGVARTPPYHTLTKFGESDETIDLDCKVFETQTPTNPGDSGGPLVNERAQLVGVTEGGWRGDVANLMTTFIDASEVRTFLNEYYTSRRIRPPADLVAPAVDPVAGMDVAKLIKTAAKGDVATRVRAITALGQIGGDARAAVQTLVPALQDKDLAVRRAAAESLTQIGGLTEGDVTVLAEVLVKDPEPDVRLSVARIVKAMGEEGVGALPAMRKAISDADPRVRVESLKAVEQLGNSGRDALPEVTKALENDKVSEVRAEAALALSKFGSDAKPAVPALVQALKKDHNLDVRLNILVAFEALGPDAKDGVPALVEMLKDKHRDVRRHAIQGLGAMGPDGKPAVTELLPFLLDNELREAAGDTLAKIGKDAVKPIVKANLVLSPRPDVRLIVVQTLGKIGPDAQAALPQLLILSRRDRVQSVQQAAQEAIRSIQGKALQGP